MKITVDYRLKITKTLLGCHFKRISREMMLINGENEGKQI
jgi:hypothetical protein